MKAIYTTKQGPADVLQLRDFEKPVPKENEVLIEVHAATVTQGDVILRKMHPLLFLPMRLFGMRRKRIPGHEYAGVVEAVGGAVRRFQPGDKVFGTTTGLSAGANAEYVCVPEEWPSGVLERMPEGVPFEQAAALPVGGMTALQILRRADIQAGTKVLIAGASGSVGTYAVQLAHHFGAVVTGVCSGRNAALVKSLGAGEVIDYTKEDYTQKGQIYDVVFDTVGKSSEEQAKRALRASGAFLTTNTTTKEKAEYLLYLAQLLESGAITPVLDKRYPLAETAEAHRYVESGRKRGNVVITLEGG